MDMSLSLFQYERLTEMMKDPKLHPMDVTRILQKAALAQSAVQEFVTRFFKATGPNDVCTIMMEYVGFARVLGLIQDYECTSVLL